MNVLMIILTVLLTIIRIPFTVWYIATGIFWKFILIVEFCMRKYGSLPPSEAKMDFFVAIITFEWASLLKFFHFHW